MYGLMGEIYFSEENEQEEEGKLRSKGGGTRKQSKRPTR